MLNRINKILLVPFMASWILLAGVLSYESLTQDTRKKSLPKSFAINSVLMPYVFEFNSTLRLHGIETGLTDQDLVHIAMSRELPPNVIGIAWGMGVDNVCVVDINLFWWYKLSHQQRRLVMFHELSHDIFNLEHFDTTVMNTPMPQSINKLYVDSAINDLINYLKENNYENFKRRKQTVAKYLGCRY